MTVKHWNPELIDQIVGGTLISGFAEDKMSSFEIQGDQILLIKGVDGGFTRSIQPGSWARWTLSLMSSSKSNDYLSALHAADLLVPGAGIVTAAWNDRNGTGLMASAEAYVEKYPAVNFGNKAEAREWSIIVINPRVFVGGT